MTVYVHYRADIWAEVSHDGEIVTVAVDVDSMAVPLGVLSADGAPVESEARADAIEAAQSQEWPTWDYGSSPVTREFAVCLDGVNASPPEDVGGSWG